MRSTLCLVLAVCACGAPFSTDNEPVPLFSTGGGFGGAGGGSNTGGGAPTGGGQGTGGGIIPKVNLSEKVWLAQAGVWRTGAYLERTYGKNAVDWLRFAQATAGRPVTTGALVQNADGSGTYAPGGTLLTFTTSKGIVRRLRVDALVGDVSNAAFPRDNEGVDVSWVFDDGDARCVLSKGSSHFEGFFLNEAEESVELRLSETFTSESSSGPGLGGSGYSVDTYGTRRSVGWLKTEDGNRVDFDTDCFYSTCNGTCGTREVQDYYFEHATKVTFPDGRAWSLNYVTGWTKAAPASIANERWAGTILGPVPGSLVKTPVANTSALALDVVIGSDRYTTRGVVAP